MRTLKEAAGGRPADHPELGVSGRLWDAHEDNSLLSGTACPTVVPPFLANVYLFMPEFGARPQLPPALSFSPTGEAAATYSGKALLNCLFF